MINGAFGGVRGFSFFAGALLGLAIVLSGCGNQGTRVALVKRSTQKPLNDPKPGGQGSGNSGNAITAEITVSKALLFDQTFFYGADLQHSSQYDPGMDLYNQSITIGHIPVFFRRNGKEVQLVADNRRLYPSEVNHPERLISRYRILAEDESTVTFSEADSSEYLATQLDSSGELPRNHWARSFEFVADGNYLLQESSVTLPDGTTGEFLESVFPAANLKPSASFSVIEMDPENPSEARYRMLPAETLRDGERKLAHASHYDIGDGATIDWYVTRNITDEELPVVRDAVEGWNRYFKAFQGIGRKVVVFKGRLPEGVKLGDPRYNVVNWDNRKIAGAAYETQSADPFTGKQSHSLIYMPVAWFKIGSDYWASGQYSDEAAKPASGVKGRRFCMRDLRAAADVLHSSRMKSDEMKVFATQLMKQTLFHEVGHALGLDHNFKGSLSFDRADPKSVFSTSIMDYNDYEIEREAFSGTDAPDGPLLEYDRQVLSAIYNAAKDVKSTDPVVPVCNDSEADTDGSGAVDPLCIRYDIEKDPTASVETAARRLTKDSLAGDVTLKEAIGNLVAEQLAQDRIQALGTREAIEDFAETFVRSLAGVVNFYVAGGKVSLLKTIRANLKSVYVFEKDVLPAGYSEYKMRGRMDAGVAFALGLHALPDASKTAVKDALARAMKAIQQAPGFGTLGATGIAKLRESLEKGMNKGISDSLMRARTGVLGLLKVKETIPFYLGTLSGHAFDFERTFSGDLIKIIENQKAGPEDRVTAATSLATYLKRPVGGGSIEGLRKQIRTELQRAKTNEARETALKIDRALSTHP